MTDHYSMGRDIGELLARVKALEERLDRHEHGGRCSCGGDAPRAGHGDTVVTEDIRMMTEKEQSSYEKGRGEYCVYGVAGFVGRACPGIRIGDFLCVSPCDPPCPDINRINLFDAKGNFMCTVIVRWAGGGRCQDCPPGGHKFVWK